MLQKALDIFLWNDLSSRKWI